MSAAARRCTGTGVDAAQPGDRNAEGVSKFGGAAPDEAAGAAGGIAPAFVFLVAPVCSSYITGEILPIIGGY